MEYLTIIFLVIGAIFLLTEFFIPGFGFFGIAGILLVAASAVMTIFYIPYGTFIVVAEIAIFALLGYLIFEYFKQHGKDSRIILNETLKDDESNVETLRAYIGKEAITRTPLKPFGNIDIDGNYVEACSDGEFIGANEKVLIIREYENKLYVRKII